MSGKIIVEIADSIATVRFYRPDKLNSVTRDMLYSFTEETTKLIQDSNIKAIVFTGEGERAFSAGFDLDTVKSLEGEGRKEFFTTLQTIMDRMREAESCITLAACNGYAIGFGAMVSIACDFRFFAENVVFRLPEVDLDIFPGAGASSNLVHLVGRSKAKEILLSGKKVSAEEALRIGLADRVLPLEYLLPVSYEFIKDICQKDWKIVQNTKSVVEKIVGIDIKQAAEVESQFYRDWLNGNEA